MVNKTCQDSCLDIKHLSSYCTDASLLFGITTALGISPAGAAEVHRWAGAHNVCWGFVHKAVERAAGGNGGNTVV